VTGFNAKAFVQSLTESPGVYRMLNDRGEPLYIGKARNLRARVGSYFSRSAKSSRIAVMVRQVATIEVTVTHTEIEALLLENNLIKTLKPRYNIQLRDDKSYPYIYLSSHEFPRLGFYRGARKEKGRFFGPYPSASSVRESLSLLQKVFPVRQCDDSVFRSRSRPCLQYQIKRCTAPCVGYISKAAYDEDVRHAVLFLEGQSQRVVDEMVKRMDAAANEQDYENAARYRDRIAALRQVQERQAISSDSGDADVVAVAAEQGGVCVGVTFIRAGRNLGTKHLFPRSGGISDPGELLAGLLSQYYIGKPVPPTLYLSHAIADSEWLESALLQQTGHRVTLVSRPRGLRRQWIRQARVNAQDALRRHLQDQASLRSRFEALQEALALEGLPERIECFDISHTRGEATVAACVAFTPDGPLKSDYRRYNIQGIAPGDDYAAMHQALSRRYRRATGDDSGTAGKLPDLLLIDGGKGQVASAAAAMAELGLEGVTLLGVAKGETRKPGKERLFLFGQSTATILPPDSPALHLIQLVRDEAHRFAITGHRQRRARARTGSVLEEIPGVGDRRRQALLRHLGGLQEVARAGIEDLVRVPGISPALARRIHASFHDGDA